VRTLSRDKAAAEALREELNSSVGSDARYDAALKAHFDRWPTVPSESEARWFAERLATLLTASVLIRAGVAAVSDGYVATRIAGRQGRVAGAVSGIDTTALIARIAE